MCRIFAYTLVPDSMGIDNSHEIPRHRYHLKTLPIVYYKVLLEAINISWQLFGWTLLLM